MRLTLRTLLAYLDDTLPPAEATKIGHKVAESEQTRELIEKIKKLTRKRGLASPSVNIDDPASNPNTVAEYLSDNLSPDLVTEFESACLDTEINLAEVAACHQILTLLLSEPARVPPTARKRMYELVKGPESLPNRKPGLTIPVGGMPTETPTLDPQEDNPGLLQGHSRASFGIRGAIALVLFIAMIVSTWLAWPRAFQQAKSTRIEVAEANPNDSKPPANNTESKESEKDKGNKGQPEKKPENPTGKESGSATTPDPTRKGSTTDQGAGDSPTKPMKTPRPDTPVEPDKVDPYRIDKTVQSVGTLASKEQVLLSSSSAESWMRVGDAGSVNAGERLLCLPGYKAKVQLDSQVTLTFWGNVPDQIPKGPLESSATLHVPPSKLAADLTLHAGRLYIQSTNPKGAKVRVRMAGRIADIQLPDEKTEVAVDVHHERTKGLQLDLMPEKRVDWALAAFRGTVKLEWNTPGLPAQLAANEGFGTWLTQPSSQLAKQLERQLIYPDSAAASNAQKSLASFAASFQVNDRITVKLAEASNGESPARARIAVFGQAAIGNISEVVEGLLDASRPLVRDAAIVALRASLAIEPNRTSDMTKVLQTKLGIAPQQSQWIVSLLRGPDEQELKSREVLFRLVDGLTAESLPVRELCHRTLLLDYDPEASKVPGLVRYDPAGPVEDRESCQKLWRKRIDERTK